MTNLPFGLYVHIPYCHKKCNYCDFTTYAVARVPEERYVAALTKELATEARKNDWCGRPLRSIFFGGGTPSLFHPRSIATIVAAAKDLFPFETDIEITVEANPEDLLPTHLDELLCAEVNRLSIGIQTFSPELLKRISRIHTLGQITAGLTVAFDARFKNLSIDLLYGLPGQTLKDLEHDLASVVQYPLTHLSAYSLTVERGTPLFSHVAKGDVTVPDDDLIAEMMELLTTTLRKHRLYRYEVSNFATPGSESVHNCGYWRGDDYLGIGVGAHTFCRRVDSFRAANLASPDEYIKRIEAELEGTAWMETLSLQEEIREYLMLGLRLREGVSLLRFRERFGHTIEQLYPQVCDTLEKKGFLKLGDDHIAATPQGMQLLDSVTSQFLDPKL